MSTKPPQPTEQRLQAARQILANRFLGKPAGRNVVGVGIGPKLIEGVDTGTTSVRVYVSIKHPLEHVAASSVVTSPFPDVSTDVIAMDFPVSPFPGVRHEEADGHSGANIAPGASIGPHQAGNPHSISGTLGLVIKDKKKKLYILGTNHVLAIKGRVPVGTDIVSPAFEDLHHAENPIAFAELESSVPLLHGEVNFVDCALAKVKDGYAGKVSPVFPDGRTITDIEVPKIGDKVVMFGKSTGKLTGTVTDITAEMIVDYGFGTFRFADQFLIEWDDGGLAADGDSGAAVVLKDKDAAVGLAFAPVGKLTVACKLSRTMKELSERIEAKLELAKPETARAMSAQKT
ncbi:MAG: hypothetical protein FJW20_00785 [Acidimicrobiia bacterium]|nr:hypothetical protein [Acidimicrobiia bacterium]